MNAKAGVPFDVASWPLDADGFEANLCTVCGTPTRYGSRHSQCAPGAVKPVEVANAAPPEVFRLTEGLGMMVSQRATYDCVLACLTMATGRHYDELWPQDFRDAIEKAKGTGSGDLHERAFALAGLESKRDYISVYCGSVPADLVRKLIWSRRALIQVPSLNHERASHYVYWDGECVFDPSTKQRYQWLSSMAPEWVALLRA